MLVFLVMLQSAGQAPVYHVHVNNHSSLTAPGEIIQILRDRKGFVWLLSPTKLQRYDGKNFLSFRFNDRCINIAEDNRGEIWLASRTNIYRYKDEHAGFEKLIISAGDSSDNLVLHITEKANLLLLKADRLLQWNPVIDRFEKLPLPAFKSGSFPFLNSAGNCIFYRKNDSLLIRYNMVSGSYAEVAVYKANYLFPINEDSVWVRQSIGGSALVSFKTKSTRPVSASQFSETFDDNFFFITGSNRAASFVCISNKGYYSFDREQNRFRKIKLLYRGLPLGGSPPINNFYQEKNGTIWFANEEGLIHFNAATNAIGLLRSNPAANENWNNNIRAFTEDDAGNIWFATANGFAELQKQTGTVKVWLPKFESENGLNYSSVRSIGYNKGKIILGQSEKGFWIFNPATNTYARPLFETDSIKEEFQNSFNSNMIRLRNGNFLIMSRQVWILEKENFMIRKLKLKGIEPMPRTAYEDAAGRIWFAGGGGVFAVDQQFNTVFSLPDKETGRWCNAIVQVSDSTYWLAARNIYEIVPGAAQPLRLSPVFSELKEQHISHLFKDSLQHIWLFSDNGMYRYLPERKLLEKFEQDDNVQQFYVGLSNSFRAGDGTVYAGSISGINYFLPEKIPITDDTLQVQLLNITVNQDDTLYLQNRQLPRLRYDQNSLVFQFVAPYAYSSDKVVYRCQLAGSDKDWVYLGNNNSVRYTAVQPGQYLFRVAASLNGKDWYEPVQPFSFIIAPPFWKTWWFRIVAAIIALGTTLMVMKRRIKRVKERAAIRQQLTELEVIALRAQMNPHFIFNAMNSIQQFTLKNDTDSANLYISKFSTLLRKVLHSSQQNYITLEEEISQLQLYLDIERLRLGNEFHYKLETNAELEPDAIKIPGMLVQPFVENAIKHGLALKQGEKKVEVQFGLKDNNTLEVTITDNGIGLTRARELKLQSDRLLPHESRGIALVEQRIRLLSKPGESVVMKMDELNDDEGHSLGTNVRILIPVKATD